jgi:hypothetical protein
LKSSGEDFSAEPCVEDFPCQLEFNIDRLKQHECGYREVYDLIVYLPIDNTFEVEAELLKLRKRVDRRLSETKI